MNRGTVRLGTFQNAGLGNLATARFIGLGILAFSRQDGVRGKASLSTGFKRVARKDGHQ
jgi:hypothetical protein